MDPLAYQGCHGVVSRVCAIEIFGIAIGLVDKFGEDRRDIVHAFAADISIVVPIEGRYHIKITMSDGMR
jgi:hypothetical protein